MNINLSRIKAIILVVVGGIILLGSLRIAA